MDGETGALAHAEVQRLTLRPGDRIILRYPYHLPDADKRCIAIAACRDLRLGDDVPVLVLDSSATVAVIGPEPAAARDEAAFLEASVAVWREIDRLNSRPEGYHPTAMDVELRQREREAWERYREHLDAP